MTNKKFGFTLAEVLITLAIIGVVAALTLPTLMTNYSEKVTMTKLKKMHAVLNEAYSRAVAEKGAFTDWNITFTATDDMSKEEKIQSQAERTYQFYNNMKSVFNITEDCAWDKPGCFYDGYYKRMDGNQYFSFFASKVRYMVKLSDGSSVAFISGGSTPSGGIYYDINGPKEPNVFGKDLFQFDVSSDYKSIVPSGYTYSDKDRMNLCYGAGLTCQAWIFKFDNMDYLHCKGLSWNGKHSCKE